MPRLMRLTHTPFSLSLSLSLTDLANKLLESTSSAKAPIEPTVTLCHQGLLWLTITSLSLSLSSAYGHSMPPKLKWLTITSNVGVLNLFAVWPSPGGQANGTIVDMKTERCVLFPPSLPKSDLQDLRLEANQIAACAYTHGGGGGRLRFATADCLDATDGAGVASIDDDDVEMKWCGRTWEQINESFYAMWLLEQQPQPQQLQDDDDGDGAKGCKRSTFRVRRLLGLRRRDTNQEVSVQSALK